MQTRAPLWLWASYNSGEHTACHLYRNMLRQPPPLAAHAALNACMTGGALIPGSYVLSSDAGAMVAKKRAFRGTVRPGRFQEDPSLLIGEDAFDVHDMVTATPQQNRVLMRADRLSR